MKTSKALTTSSLMILLGVFSMDSWAQAEEYLVKLDARTNNAEQPVNLPLRAGRYEVTPVAGDSLSWSVWAQTNCQIAAGCERGGTVRYTGMHNNYYIQAQQLTQVSVNGVNLPITSSMPSQRDYSYFLSANNIRAYEVAEKHVYPDEKSALNNAQNSIFTLANADTVKFMLYDASRIDDNRGGMTLIVRKLAD